ncbi:MAG: glycosyltransferase [Methylophilaceae bacterium]
MDSLPRCVLVTCFAKEQPGYLDFSYRIQSLANQYRLTVISTDFLNNEELKFDGVEYLVIPSTEGKKGWLKYLWLCGVFINKQKPDVVVLLHSAAAPIALMVDRKIPSAVYWNEHPTHTSPSIKGFHPIKNTLRAFTRWIMFAGARKANIVMPIGEAHYLDLLKHKCDKNHVQLIYMGVANNFRNIALNHKPALSQPLDQIKIIYVGSVSKARGRDVMLEALKLVNAQKSIAHLTIVGASQYELQYCQHYIFNAGLEDCVTVVGRVSGMEIPQYLQSADVGICLWEDQPWWRFNPPTKLFEYLVAGLPVLASDIATHTEYIADWKNGMIFEYNSYSLAEAIKSISERKSEFSNLKIKASESGEKYLWSKIEPQFLQAIKRLS